jgi:hypothetical protein
MKKIIALMFIVGLFFAVRVSAEEPYFPSAGITPASPFYFLDRLGEALREFFTFNPGAKARLQISFAAERVAEIKVVLETRGVEARGLEVAQSRLQANLARAALIIDEEKQKGKEISGLAKDLNSGIDSSKLALLELFKEQKTELRAKEKEIKSRLREARHAGDDGLAGSLREQLSQVKFEKKQLDLKEDEIKESVEEEEDKIEEKMEPKHKAGEAIKEAMKKKQEIMDEAAKEGLELPAGVFQEFDNLFSQSQTAFEAGNFAVAREIAKQAKKAIKGAEKSIEQLEEEKEKQEDELEEKRLENKETRKEDSEKEEDKVKKKGRESNEGDDNDKEKGEDEDE